VCPSAFLEFSNPDDFITVAVDEPTRLREQQMASGSDDQLVVERLLERADLTAVGGLRQAQFVAGSATVPSRVTIQKYRRWW